MRTIAIITICISLLTSCGSDEKHDWSEYLGGSDRNHYSALDQIDTTNVTKLSQSWIYHTGDSGQMQCNPIVVKGVLYGMTATVQPFALDAATGKEIWRIRDSTKTTWYGTSRGVAYWEDGDDQRILYTKESWLCAVDAKTGKLIESFGTNGKVSLKQGLGPRATDKFVISNTPGTIYEDLIIMPLRLSEDIDAAMGYVQAFNVRTGKLEWVFKTIPDAGTPGYETWPEKAYLNENVGAANNWAGMAVDRDRGIVFVPTGSAAFDYWGGFRLGQNLYANCLLALDAKTGKLRWHYQMVHHDILDRDPPAPPNLIQIRRDGKLIDAVAQVTKQGFVFVFDRETGEPVFPIEERPAPSSDVPGEEAWPTQPFPLKPLPYARQSLTENDLNPYSNFKDSLTARFRKSRFEGPFTPLTTTGTIVFPGLDGGAEWGGAAVDPAGIMYVNSSEMAWLLALNPRDEINDAIHPGERIYNSYCGSCHGAERKGNTASGFPSLIGLNKKYQRDEVFNIISGGKGMMPAFKNLTEAQKKILVAFLFGDKVEKDKEEVVDTSSNQKGYRISGFTKFLDEEGYPAIAPPWGTLNAIDLNSGEYRWKKVFGTYPELEAKGIPQTGSESYGGPVITKGNVLFIAGTKDARLRAYSMVSGRLLWETNLPAAGFATPATYSIGGKQYVVVACGGTKLGANKGDAYVAFAFPD